MKKEIKGAKLEKLFTKVAKLPAIDVAIVWPESTESLRGAIFAAKEGIINPLLIGNRKELKKVADLIKADISQYPFFEATLENASKIAIQLVHEKKAQAIMKGSLHTRELMVDIVHHESNMQIAHRMSHCMLVDIPAYHKPIIITDVAINISPDLSDKKDLIENAVHLAHVLGIKIPKVALLSAVETISERLPNTMDYAVLCKMAERGQIADAILDGPVAFDDAVSAQAAICKKVQSKVTGDPDILVVPEIEAGNILFKSLAYLADAISYGIALGARVPIILTGRAARITERVGSCKLAKYYVAANG